jgi:hypothetical protein
MNNENTRRVRRQGRAGPDQAGEEKDQEGQACEEWLPWDETSHQGLGAHQKSSN